MNQDKNNQQELKQETNDNNKDKQSSSIQNRGNKASAMQPAQHQQAPKVPPLHHPRPVRPNLRRQVMVAACGSQPSGPPLGGTIELADVLASRSIVPPKRPTYLPARYDTYTRRAPLIAGNDPAIKPNRYSWAQMQHWRQQAIATGARFPVNGHFHHHFSAPFSSAASRGLLVVNPMQIVNLSEHTKSSLIKFIEAVKRFSEQWFSHVLLLLFLAVYACFGAYIFISFEADNEQGEKQLIIDTRHRLVNESWSEAKEKNRDEFFDAFRVKFEDYERLLNKAFASGMSSTSLENQWTFWNALFFSMTVFTTIGYGHLTPITFAGRVATMVYAIFGIPILLMVLADLGKLLTRIIKYAFKKFRHLFNKILRKKGSVRTRKIISDNTNQYIGFAKNTFERGFAYIQPNYDRIPRAFRISSFRRKMRFKKKASDMKETSDTNEQSNGTTAANLQQHEADKKTSETTDVIVTPGKQTKPVSPQVNEKKSLADHHHYHQHQHHHRAQSPGHNQSGRKKTSAISPSGSKKAQHSKSSVSRSSSSSIVVQASGGEKAMTAKVQQQVRINPQKSAPSNEHDYDATKTSPLEADKLQSETLSDLEALDVQADDVDDDADFEGEDDDIEDEFDIPVSFALFLLVTYMMLGAVVFSIWEGWNFFDSLYFVFISMSTIGFGDLVPQHPKRMIGTFIYLLFGLALTSMCINVVQEKIHATFLRAKMQIGEKMGLDLEQIMADDYYDGSMEGDEEDSANSVANSLSQTNSTSAPQVGGLGECYPPNASEDNNSNKNPAPNKGTFGSYSIDGHEGVKQSKSRDSLRSLKRRNVASLPGPSNGSHSGLLRRKPSKKIMRQSAPLYSPQAEIQQPAARPQPSQSPQIDHCSTVAASPSLAVSDADSAAPVSSDQQAAPKLEIEIRKTEQLSNSLDPPSINQPVSNNVKGICEPLKKLNKDTINYFVVEPTASKLVNIRAPIIVAKSLSSDSRPYGTSPLEASKHLFSKQNHGRSADSSRRSSVSHELSALDDLIVALSQSPSERFGPLLGVPSIARSRSRSPSPSSLLSTLVARRGTSMTNRPTRSSLHPLMNNAVIKNAR